MLVHEATFSDEDKANRISSVVATVGLINIPIIKAIDTTAAGDSFNGSFLAYHLKNKHLSIEEKILSSHVITKNVLKYRGAIIPKTKMKI